MKSLILRVFNILRFCMKQYTSFLACAILLLLSSCSSSYRNDIAEMDIKKYRNKIDHYQNIEDEYVNVLFNLERMPDDPELLSNRVLLKDSLNVLRDELKYLQVKSELSLTDWEKGIKKQESDYKTMTDVYKHIEKDLQKNLKKMQ